MIRPMSPIPISSAEAIAKQYGYEQVVIYGRRTGGEGGEHMTTYGIDKTHCGIAAKIGDTLQRFMGWRSSEDQAVERAAMLRYNATNSHYLAWSQLSEEKREEWRNDVRAEREQK